MNPNFKEIGETFVHLYYERFDTNRAQLAPLYELPFSIVKHIITTVDCQPTVNHGVVAYVVGQLKTDNDPPHGFSQCFVLMRNDESSYYILNDMFRLSLHHG